MQQMNLINAEQPHQGREARRRGQHLPKTGDNIPLLQRHDKHMFVGDLSQAQLLDGDTQGLQPLPKPNRHLRSSSGTCIRPTYSR